MNIFQTIVLAVFAILAVVATILFSGYFDAAQNSSASELTVWGTLPQEQMQVFFATLNNKKLAAQLTYQWHDPSTFDSDLTNALADGRGPDLIIYPQDLIAREQDRLAPISETLLPLRTVSDVFVDEAALLHRADGSLGVPLLVDPMMMFWNKDLFTNAAIALPPQSWEQLLGLVTALTQKDDRGNVTQSAVALGEYANIPHTKQMLATLFLQVGSSIVKRDSDGMRLAVDIGGNTEEAADEAAVRFYTEFSNPTKADVYTWNTALPSARDLFAGGSLAMMFAPFSEAAILHAQNPHLNFDIALMPQRENGSVKATFGTLYAVAPLKVARDVNAATEAALLLGQTEQVQALAQALSLAPARRDLLQAGTSDPNLALAYRSAIITRAWLDPNPTATETLFSQLVTAVTSGQAQESDAIATFSSRLNDLMPKSIVPGS